MTPQSEFMVAAPILPGHKEALLQLFASMNTAPGVLNPYNAVITFAELPQVHFARFVILDDETAGDITAYDLPIPDLPTYLVMMADVDGSADAFLSDLVAKCGTGLQKIFGHCEVPPHDDLRRWIAEHRVRAAANYINWHGRTVQQAREEAALRQALQGFIQQNAASLQNDAATEVHRKLRVFVADEQRSGHLRLSPTARTPLGHKIRNFLHLIGVPLVLLILAPVLLLFSPIFLYQLRRREKSDPEITPRAAADHITALAQLEDHQSTNQFNAFGSLKPGLFRRWLTTFLLWIVNYTTAHIYARGRLGRVRTIHFARWIFLDGKRRLLFASNYDGSHSAYMDDFINKVAFGLNIVFSNGIGYPQTNWLIKNGAKEELKFKNSNRRHQLPSQVWYNALPGLTAIDMQRNGLIREGIEQPRMTERDLGKWLQLL